MGGHDEPIADLARGRVGALVRGKWRLERVLGVGGMACVYAATHAKGNQVAVKMLHPARSNLAGLKARFLREGYAANAVGHPGVVRVLDGGVAEDGAAFLVMELVDGETLEAHWIRRGRQLQPGEVLYIADRILDILAAAHAAGVLHRDVKPENVMLTRDGVVRLLDFGIASLPDAARSSGRERPDLTVGTPAFMAPEQLRGAGDDVDARADLWALGATMFLLLAGRHVHAATSLHEQVTAAATRDAPSLREALPFAPPKLIELVDHALAFRKEDRWPDAAAMRVALRLAAAELGEPVHNWDVELPAASISSRPAPVSLRPGAYGPVIDPRTPTLATLETLPQGRPRLGPRRNQRRSTSFGFISGTALLAALGFCATQASIPAPATDVSPAVEMSPAAETPSRVDVSPAAEAPPRVDVPPAAEAPPCAAEAMAMPAPTFVIDTSAPSGSTSVGPPQCGIDLEPSAYRLGPPRAEEGVAKRPFGALRRLASA